MNFPRSRKSFIIIDLFNIDLLFPKTFKLVGARRLKKKVNKRQNKGQGIKEVRISYKECHRKTLRTIVIFQTIVKKDRI